MLHNYNSFILILESKAREKKINKTEEKIKKFANFSGIYKWSVEKCITDKSTEGIQYAVWVANQLKYVTINGIMDTVGIENNDITRKQVEDYIKNGKGSDEKLEKLIEKEWTDIDSVIVGMQEAINDTVNYVLDWLKNPLRTETVNLSNLTMDEAHKKSEEWHNSLKATGKITDESGEVIIEFEDGYYWIDLKTTYSKDEANAMGHCGNTNDGDTLLSLRDKNKSPHVTVAWHSEEKAIFQMKGRQNKKPVEKYYPYIYRFLVDPEMKPKYFAYEWNKAEDFNLSDFDKETFQKVFNYNPDLIYDSIQYDFRMVNGLIKKGYFSKEQVKDVLFNAKGVKFDVFMNLVHGYTEDDEEIDMFDNEELKQIWEQSNISLKSYGELPIIILYNKNIITDEEFVSYFNELFIEEQNGKNIIRIEGDEDDLESFMSDSVKSLLFDDDPFAHWDFPYYKIEKADYVWSYLTKETKAKVIEKMIGEEIDYKHWSDSKDRYFENVTITEDMIKWVGNDFYLFYNGQRYEIDKILDENDGTDLFDQLSMAYKQANDVATLDEYIKTARKALEDELGTIIRRDSKTVTTYSGKKKYYETMVFNFHDVVDDLDTIETHLMEEYEHYMDGSIDYERENYGSFWAILKEFKDKADFDDGYGLYGTIDKNVLNDSVIINLSWL